MSGSDKAPSHTLSWLTDLNAYLETHQLTSRAESDQRQLLIRTIKSKPLDPGCWLDFLRFEESCAANLESGDGRSSIGSVNLYHLYYWATQLVPRSRNQTREEYIWLWIGFAKQQWLRSHDDARDTFKTLKNQQIGDGCAFLYSEWAKLEYASGSVSKAISVLQKGIKEGAQPLSLLMNLRAEWQSSTLDLKTTSQTADIATGRAAFSRQKSAHSEDSKEDRNTALDSSREPTVHSSDFRLMDSTSGAPAGTNLTKPMTTGISPVTIGRMGDGAHTGSSLNSKGSALAGNDLARFATQSACKSSATGTSGASSLSMDDDTISCRGMGRDDNPGGVGGLGLHQDARKGGHGDTGNLTGGVDGRGYTSTTTTGIKPGLRRFGFKTRALRVEGAKEVEGAPGPQDAGVSCCPPPSGPAPATSLDDGDAAARRKRRAEGDCPPSPTPVAQQSIMVEGYKRRMSPIESEGPSLENEGTRVGAGERDPQPKGPGNCPKDMDMEVDMSVPLICSRLAARITGEKLSPGNSGPPGAQGPGSAICAPSMPSTSERPPLGVITGPRPNQGMERQGSGGQSHASRRPALMPLGDLATGYESKPSTQEGRDLPRPALQPIAGQPPPQVPASQPALPESMHLTNGRRSHPPGPPASSTSLPAENQSLPDQTQPKEDAHTVYVRNVRYTKLECVGRGGSSKVFKVMAPNCKIYALKRIRLQGRDPEAATGFIDEITLLKRLRGKPNIIQLIDAQVFNHEGLIYMVLEYGDIDLARLLAKHEQARKQGGNKGDEIDENFIRLYWQQMLQAVQTVHDLRIVHSDLKPANFMLVEGQLKLIDFGIAKTIQNDTTSIARESQVGTLNYMSPEAILGGTNNILGAPPMKVGRPSDVWSLGCILYQMIFGRTPFADLPFIQKMHAICDNNYRIPFPACPNPDAADVIQRCLERDPKRRITMAQLLDHDFLYPSRRFATENHVAATVSTTISSSQPAPPPPPGVSVDQLKMILSQVAQAGALGADNVTKITQDLLKQISQGETLDISATISSITARAATNHQVEATSHTSMAMDTKQEPSTTEVQTRSTAPPPKAPPLPPGPLLKKPGPAPPPPPPPISKDFDLTATRNPKKNTAHVTKPKDSGASRPQPPPKPQPGCSISSIAAQAAQIARKRSSSAPSTQAQPEPQVAAATNKGPATLGDIAQQAAAAAVRRQAKASEAIEALEARPRKPTTACEEFIAEIALKKGQLKKVHTTNAKDQDTGLEAILRKGLEKFHFNEDDTEGLPMDDLTRPRPSKS